MKQRVVISGAGRIGAAMAMMLSEMNQYEPVTQAYSAFSRICNHRISNLESNASRIKTKWYTAESKEVKQAVSIFNQKANKS